MKKTITAIVIGAGQRGNAYGDYALLHPDELDIVGVAEPNRTLRQQLVDKHQIPLHQIWDTWEQVFEQDKLADAVFICTQDTMHYSPAMAAIEKGYDILLEKPISPSPQECEDIAIAAKTKGVKVVVCHVLRYSPFFVKIKEIISSGHIGEIVSINHNENVGHIHHSHSFVRGNWSVEANSAPMILAKSCHDLDMIQWLLDKDCQRLSSFGSLSYFCQANAPHGAKPRCTDGCQISCPYDARKLYLENGTEWFRTAAVGHYEASDQEVQQALETGPYGRCVFQHDNDVVDHQVVQMLFDNQVTVTFTMSAFTPETSRSIKIMGTKGEIKGHTDKNQIIVSHFLTGDSQEIPIGEIVGGHDGGDIGIMRAFCQYVGSHGVPIGVSEIDISTKNHLLCFAAETSRLNGGRVIELA